jgi:hypothetical protein
MRSSALHLRDEAPPGKITVQNPKSAGIIKALLPHPVILSNVLNLTICPIIA